MTNQRYRYQFAVALLRYAIVDRAYRAAQARRFVSVYTWVQDYVEAKDKVA